MDRYYTSHSNPLNAAAPAVGATQPRISDRMQGRFEQFSIGALLDIHERAGVELILYVSLLMYERTLKRKGGAQPKPEPYATLLAPGHCNPEVRHRVSVEKELQCPNRLSRPSDIRELAEMRQRLIAFDKS